MGKKTFFLPKGEKNLLTTLIIAIPLKASSYKTNKCIPLPYFL